MADTPAILLRRPRVLLATTTVGGSGSGVSTPAILLRRPRVLLATTTVGGSGVGVSTPAILLRRPRVRLAGYSVTGSSAAPVRTRAILLRRRAAPRSPGDTATLIIHRRDSHIPTFPGASAMVEILYPVIPANSLNKILTRMDSKEWRAAAKTGTPVVRRAVRSLRFRVDTPYMATFEGDLQANAGVEFRLQTPGYRPFGIDSQDNIVRLVDYSEPQREDGGRTYLVEVAFRFIRTYP